MQRVISGELTAAEAKRIGFPWSPELVERSRRSVGATIEAARAALDEGISANLAGGTHHAFADQGEGFCVFNDVAVAIRTLQHEQRITRAVVIDTDVHHGNGTAKIFADDSNVFTFSIHAEKNYPLRKPPSSLDIPLPNGTGDREYLEALRRGLDSALAPSFQPTIAFFVAGADPFVDDRYGRLGLTKEGLEQRDQKVIQRCRNLKIPVAIAMAGGYADCVEDIVSIHETTIRLALRRKQSER